MFLLGNTSGTLYKEKCYLAELDEEHVLATLKYSSIRSSSILDKGRHGTQNYINPTPPRLVKYNHPMPNPPKNVQKPVASFAAVSITKMADQKSTD